MIVALCILYGLSLALSISGAEIFGGLLLVRGAYLWRKIPIRPDITKSPLAISILVYAAWLLLCSVINQSTPFSEAISEQAAFLVFFLAAYGLLREDRERIIMWFCIGSAIAGAWGGLQAIFPNALPFLEPHSSGRVMGPRSHPLTYAEGFIPAIFLMAAWLGNRLFARDEKVSRHWKGIVALVLIEVGLVLSQSRGVWLAVSVSFFMLLFLWPRKHSIAAVVFFFLPGLILFGASPDLRGRARTIVFPTQEKKVSDESTSIRMELWRQGAETVMQNPVTGVGIDGPRLKTITWQTGEERIWKDSHSVYLQAALEGGLIGLGMLLWIFYAGFRCVLQMRAPWRYPLLAIYIAFLLAGLTESWTHDKEIAILFCGLLGSIDRLRRI